MLSHNSAARREDRSLERLSSVWSIRPRRERAKKAQLRRAPTSRHTPTYSPFSPLEFCFSGPPRDTGHTQARLKGRGKWERDREKTRLWRGWPIVLPPRLESARTERARVVRRRALRRHPKRFRTARRLVEVAPPLAVFNSGGAPCGKRGTLLKNRDDRLDKSGER